MTVATGREAPNLLSLSYALSFGAVPHLTIGVAAAEAVRFKSDEDLLRRIGHQEVFCLCSPGEAFVYIHIFF